MHAFEERQKKRKRGETHSNRKARGKQLELKQKYVTS
jgi:hypothetical protein